MKFKTVEDENGPSEGGPTQKKLIHLILGESDWSSHRENIQLLKNGSKVWKQEVVMQFCKNQIMDKSILN